MDDLTYTDRMHIFRHVPARKYFLDLLENHPDFRTEAERIGGEYRDLLDKLWSSLRANLHRDQRWSDYCTSVIELCQRSRIDSASWAPEAAHHVIARIVINQPTHHYMMFYHDAEPVNKRVRVPPTQEQQVKMAFMRIVKEMSIPEIWDRFRNVHRNTVRQQISRGRKELDIELS